MRLPRKILACTDFSPCGNDAVAYAVELGRRLDAEVIIAHLFNGHIHVQHELLRPRDPADTEARRQQGLERLAELCRAHHGKRVHLRCVCEHGDARSEIPSLAAREGADLIVVGRYGAGALGGQFAGSVADSVLNNAHVPVLAVGNSNRVEVGRERAAAEARR